MCVGRRRDLSKWVAELRLRVERFRIIDHLVVEQPTSDARV
ncbi:MAG: hypothetical protein AVDCRST_MAG64-3149 [uncultured Phycisphaerae bacterium]|uniref:Uncharacterized protein n=1 Tax=uncultured Phycisphaerae bacterium TaxID=904963 RepID=A0A6J4PYX2_9BACT|nr:MAG: hypothetical protein AVDCRST_MAG64-3149 [uncultured Phycisphaerae bacterium]